MFPHRPVEEVAFYGGSFTALPREAMLSYLAWAQQLKMGGHVSRIRLSTHPAHVDEEIVTLLQSYQVDTVELGVQSLDEEVLRRAGRGHGRAASLQAMRLLKEGGFNLGAQLMVGLPGDDRDKVLQTVADLLSCAPDFVRIYPLLVLRDTEMAKLLAEGSYQPLTLAAAVALVKDMLAIFLYAGIAVVRMGLQPTAELRRGSGQLVAGPYHESFGHLVKCALKREQLMMALLPGRKNGVVTVCCPPREIPLVYGDQRATITALQQHYRLTVKVDPALAAGSIAIGEDGGRRRLVTEEAFLKRYLEQLDGWDKQCI